MASATVSSILRTAESARNKKMQLDDDLAAYKWANSEQTLEDFEEYREYLTKRMNVTNDPAKTLALQNKVNSARRGYVSNEVQRSAIGVLEGNSTLYDKRSTLLTLYQTAVANGDLNLAQNLRNTYDSVDVAIQRKEEDDAKRMAGFAEEMSRHQVTDLQDLAESYLNGDDPESPNMSNKQSGDMLTQYGSDFLNEATTINGVQFSTWDKVYDNAARAIDALTEAANIAYANGQESRGDSLYEKALKLNNGESKISFGGVNLTLEEVNNARDAARNGQNYFQVKKDASGNNILEKNKVTNYLWARDVNGQLRIVQTFNEVGNQYNQDQVDAKGEKIKDSSVEAKLKKAGYEVLGTDSSGLLRIRDTNSTGRANADPNSSLGESYLVSIDPQTGNVRYVGERGDGGQQIYEINLADPNANDFGTAREIDADAETFFGDAQIRGSASESGVNYINKLLAPAREAANTTQLILNGTEKISLYAGDYKSLYTPGLQTDVVLQTAGEIKRDQMQDRLQAAAQATVQATLPPSVVQGNNFNGLNINQSPVPGQARLTVAKPAPVPKVVVAPPPPTPKISGVAPLPSTPKITSVGPANTSNVRLKVL